MIGMCCWDIASVWHYDNVCSEIMCRWAHSQHMHIFPIMNIWNSSHRPEFLLHSSICSSSLALTSPPPFLLLRLPATCPHHLIIFSSSLPFLLCRSFSKDQSPPTFVAPFSSSGPPCPLLPLYHQTHHLLLPLGGWMMRKRGELADDGTINQSERQLKRKQLGWVRM